MVIPQRDSVSRIVGFLQITLGKCKQMEWNRSETLFRWEIKFFGCLESKEKQARKAERKGKREEKILS
jgi:hypothetical protein